jgi:glycosyltransferase involved in cell wall biosynthesis
MVAQPDAAAVSVIVPARDAMPTIERALAALTAQRVDVDYEIVVVDDGSRDGTREIVRRIGGAVRLIENPRPLGPGGARNRGVAEATAPLLAFTDADCFPAPGWLAGGLEAIAGADIVQGRVVPDPGASRTPFDRTLQVEPGDGFFQTANLFVRRETFERVGGFRDWALERPGRRSSEDRRRGRASRTPIGEDTLFAWLARRAGARTASAPEALVHHAVFPGTVRDAVADRWHWTRDMPGLVRLVPELRRAAFHRRVFFAGWTAQSELMLAGLLLGLLTRRRAWLLLTAPYVRRMVTESRMYGDPRARARFAAGMPLVDAVTVAGLVLGSVQWRSPVL